MTNLASYLDYFKTLQREHIAINSFFVMDIQEPLNALRTGMVFPALLMNNVTGSLISPNFDNVTDEIKCEFLILGHLENLDDFPAEMQLLADMKDIGMDIVRRMRNDVYKCESRAMKAIPGFSVNSVTYQMADQVFENSFGFHFTFSIYCGIDLSYNASRWVGKVIPK